jgi:hypothetical protein
LLANIFRYDLSPFDISGACELSGEVTVEHGAAHACASLSSPSMESIERYRLPGWNGWHYCLSHEETATAQGLSTMWILIVGVLSLGLGIIALIGLLAVAKDLVTR